MMSSLAAEGAERPMIEVDTDGPFASVDTGGSLSLTGVGLKRSAAATTRRRRRLAVGASDSAIVQNNGGTLNIVGSELHSEDSLVLSSTGATGELTISSSLISGRVYADQGKVPNPNPNPNLNPNPNPNPNPQLRTQPR